MARNQGGRVRCGTGRDYGGGFLPFGSWKDVFRKPVPSSGDVSPVSMGGLKGCSRLWKEGERIEGGFVWLRRRTANRCVSRAQDARRAKLVRF
jgi:hypothetical protein